MGNEHVENGGKKIIITQSTKNHIGNGHKEPGFGSIFAPGFLFDGLKVVLKNIPIEQGKVFYKVNTGKTVVMSK